MRPRVEVEGERELRRALRGIEGSTEDLKAAHKAAAEVVATQARIEVPVRSGRLKGTIRALGSKTVGQVAAGQGRQVRYAGPTHFGWPSRPNKSRGWRGGPIRPQPFLYDAADKRQRQVIDVYDQHIARIVKEYDLG